MASEIESLQILEMIDKCYEDKISLDWDIKEINIHSEEINEKSEVNKREEQKENNNNNIINNISNSIIRARGEYF